jgi:hypothetical protein
MSQYGVRSVAIDLSIKHSSFAEFCVCAFVGLQGAAVPVYGLLPRLGVTPLPD